MNRSNLDEQEIPRKNTSQEANKCELKTSIKLLQVFTVHTFYQTGSVRASRAPILHFPTVSSSADDAHATAIAKWFQFAVLISN
jgi:hypothetical protein